MVRADLADRAGRGPDGQARTRKIKLAALLTQTTRDAQGQPIRDPQSTTYLASFTSSGQFGVLVRRAALARGLAQAQRVIILGDGYSLRAPRTTCGVNPCSLPPNNPLFTVTFLQRTHPQSFLTQNF